MTVAGTPDELPRRFPGRSVIVTGGGTGIGLAIAERLAREGATVMVVGPDQAVLDAAVVSLSAFGDGAVAHCADLTERSLIDGIVDGALERWGKVDVLVNCAATDVESLFVDLPTEDWDRMMAVNLTAPFLLSQRVAQKMIEAGSGSIINIGSVAALASDGPYACYSASKAALLAFTRSIAVELAPHGVRANVVSPGYTHTDALVADGPKQLAHMMNSFDRVPMGRLVQRPEVAEAVAFLASDEAAAITGTSLVVDCGLTANLYVHETLPQEEE
ncbi:MAG: glucose 1-dehydrogenase [Solirubrobacterales bacterium]